MLVISTAENKRTFQLEQLSDHPGDGTDQQAGSDRIKDHPPDDLVIQLTLDKQSEDQARTENIEDYLRKQDGD